MKLWQYLRLSAYETTLLAVFAGLFLLFSLTAPNFLSAANFRSMMVQLPELGLISLGMMAVVLTAGIDLSITFTAALSGIALAWCLSHGWPIPAAMLAGLVTALLCGAFNGGFIAGMRISPIVMTLGTMILYEGIALQFTKGGSISGFPEAYSVIGSGSVAGIPVPMLIFTGAILLTAILLNRTAWGRSVYMIGSNPTAAEFSGIRVRSVLMGVYLFSALMAALAAVIMTSRYNSAKVDYGSSYLLKSVATIVLGGVSIQGGAGTVKGVVLGAAIFQILSSALNLYGLSPHLVDVLTGTVLIFVLAVNLLNQKWKRAPRTRVPPPPEATEAKVPASR